MWHEGGEEKRWELCTVLFLAYYIAFINRHTLNFSLLHHVIYSPGSSVVIVGLNQEVHPHKRQNTTACLAQPIIPTGVDQNLDKNKLSIPACQIKNQKIDLVHPNNSHISEPRSFSTCTGQSQDKTFLPPP